MPTIERNLRLWDEEHDWPLAGDEWSSSWGGADAQWYGCILPRISTFIPAAHILEIAPGYGRWTQFLQAYATSLTLVDLAPTCIAACRSRFRDLEHLRYHVNDGRSLDMIDDESLDFVFSFDSLVHADSDTMRSYCFQIARKLRAGGTGFLHHSNLGAHKSWLLAKRAVVTLCRGYSGLGNLLIHDCSRAPQMTASLMAQFCQDAGLTCTAQEVIPWELSRRPIDCFTAFKKEKAPVPRVRQVFVNHRFMEEAANTKTLALLYGGLAQAPSPPKPTAI
jgi:SAM-dependent methyltransferase